MSVAMKSGFMQAEYYAVTCTRLLGVDHHACQKAVAQCDEDDDDVAEVFQSSDALRGEIKVNIRCDRKALRFLFSRTGP